MKLVRFFLTACLLIALVIMSIGCQNQKQDHSVLRNGIRFGMTIEAVEKAEKAKPTQSIYDSYPDLTFSGDNMELSVYGIKAQSLIYEFYENKLEGVLYILGGEGDDLIYSERRFSLFLRLRDQLTEEFGEPLTIEKDCILENLNEAKERELWDENESDYEDIFEGKLLIVYSWETDNEDIAIIFGRRSINGFLLVYSIPDSIYKNMDSMAAYSLSTQDREDFLNGRYNEGE